MMRRWGTVDGPAARRRPGARRPLAPRRSTPAVTTVALAAALLTGCGSSATATPNGSTGTSESAPATAASPSTPEPSPSAVTNTVTSTVTPPAITAQPPPPTAEPAAVDGTCPYLTDEQAADINGQRTGQTQVIDVPPHPVCVFTRSDGGWLATVRVIEAANPAEAVAAVNQHVPIDNSSPATQPAGWSGGAVVLDDRSVYAVAKDRFAVVAESNQLQTIKGRQMAITAISALGL